jgi:hypothetical protein
VIRFPRSKRGAPRARRQLPRQPGVAKNFAVKVPGALSWKAVKPRFNDRLRRRPRPHYIKPPRLLG